MYFFKLGSFYNSCRIIYSGIGSIGTTLYGVKNMFENKLNLLFEVFHILKDRSADEHWTELKEMYNNM